MCAINPSQHMKFTLDVYTSDKQISKYEFENQILDILLQVEVELNTSGKFRFHLKEVIL